MYFYSFWISLDKCLTFSLLSLYLNYFAAFGKYCKSTSKGKKGTEGEKGVISYSEGHCSFPDVLNPC